MTTWPLERAALARLLRQSNDGIQYIEHIEAVDGRTVFEHACKLGLEGIVSKRRDMPYRHGRCRTWLKIKNPASPAAKRIEDGTFCLRESAVRRLCCKTILSTSA